MIFICFTIVDLPLSPEPRGVSGDNIAQRDAHKEHHHTQEENLAFSTELIEVLLEHPVDGLALFLLLGVLLRRGAEADAHDGGCGDDERDGGGRLVRWNRRQRRRHVWPPGGRINNVSSSRASGGPTGACVRACVRAYAE